MALRWALLSGVQPEQAAFFYVFSSQKGKDKYIYESLLYFIKIIVYICRLVLRLFQQAMTQDQEILDSKHNYEVPTTKTV
jgi:hypothetical protein